MIGVYIRDQFPGLRSLARKSSGFAQIIILFGFLLENGHLKNSKEEGALRPQPPPPPLAPPHTHYGNNNLELSEFWVNCTFTVSTVVISQ